MTDTALSAADVALYRVSQGRVHPILDTLTESTLSLPQASLLLENAAVADDTRALVVLFVFKRYPALREQAIACLKQIEDGAPLTPKKAYTIFAATYFAETFTSLKAVLGFNERFFNMNAAASCEVSSLLSKLAKERIDTRLSFTEMAPPGCQ